jgi:hypothetical protein
MCFRKNQDAFTQNPSRILGRTKSLHLQIVLGYSLLSQILVFPRYSPFMQIQLIASPMDVGIAEKSLGGASDDE